MPSSPKKKPRPKPGAPAPTAPATPVADERSRSGPSAFGDWHEYEMRLQRPLMTKLAEFRRNDRLRHVIFSRQFDIPLLDRIAQIATKMREIGETREGLRFLAGLLSHKRAMLYFTQASTRTFLSFMAACQILGMSHGEIRDPSVSSEAKGESPLDSIRMFSSYFDVIIMRARYPDFAEACAYLMNDLASTGNRSVPIVNAGSGADQHPTQALLDLYTIQRIFSFESKKDSSRRTRFGELRRKYANLSKGPDGKVYCFCGDIGRGRTVRSLAQLLALYRNVTMHFVYPPHPKLRLSDDLRAYLDERGVKVSEGHKLSDVIGDIDVLYMTRIQHEHDQGDLYDEAALTDCMLTPDLVARMKEYAAIMHPFPRNGKNPEIPFEIDHDPRAKYFEQSNNGMWVRAALLASLFNVDAEIYSFYEKMFSERHDYNLGVLS
jgi:aspartate carbamoyltransferase catalytic subunit